MSGINQPKLTYLNTVIIVLTLIIVVTGLCLFNNKFNRIKSQSENINLRTNYYASLYENSNQTFEILAALAVSDDVTYEQILSQQLENATHVNEIADAYTKLAQLYLKKGSSNDLFKAVIYISRALNISYSDVRYNILAQLLNLNNNSDAIMQIGHRESEIKLLTDQLALKVGINEKFLLYARLSMIYQTGRASSYDNPHPPEMIKALSMRKQALSYIVVKNTRDIDIIFIIDDNYAKHAAATITSILMNSNPETYYNFYIIMDPDKKISPINQQKISSLSSIQPSKFEFIEFDPNIMSDINKNMQDKMSALDSASSQWPKLIVYRLFLDKVLPHLNQALYLDADIIVNEDLFKLFNKNIDDYYLAAAADISEHYNLSSRLSSCSDKKKVYYFNSGVLLLNFKKWRADNLNAKVTNLLNNTKCDLMLFDQDVLNIITDDNNLRLSNTWNYPDILNYNGSFPKFLRAPMPLIDHMYWIKNNKPWDQKDANKLWIESPGKIPQVFWPYWGYRDVANDLDLKYELETQSKF